MKSKGLMIGAAVVVPAIFLGLVLSTVLLLGSPSTAVNCGPADSVSVSEWNLRWPACSCGNDVQGGGGRRTFGMDDFEGIEIVLQDLVAEGQLTVQPAAEVFADKRTGLVFRLRRPDVFLAVESAGPLWMADSWVRRGSRGQF